MNHTTIWKNTITNSPQKPKYRRLKLECGETIVMYASELNSCGRFNGWGIQIFRFKVDGCLKMANWRRIEWRKTSEQAWLEFMQYN